MPDVFRGTRVEAIPGTPLPYGLLSAVTFPDVVDDHELNGVEWKPMGCAEAGTTDWCVDPIPPEKVFTSADVVRAEPIAVYHGYQCNPIGQTFDEAAEYAVQGLEIGEQRALEAWFSSMVLQVDAVDVTTTPGTAVNAAAGIGLLEGALASAYGGVGVIHVPAGAAAWLAALTQLTLRDDRYHTLLGNRVALGGGYQIADAGPGGVPAGPGEHWLYASGPVVARRATEPVVLPVEDSQSVNVRTNDRTVLAERTWVVGYECAVFAVLVDLCSCPTSAVS